MLALFGLVVVVLGAFVGALMGWRILRGARGKADAPERWMGLALLWICVGGYPMLLLGQAVSGHLARFAAVTTGVLSAHLGVACIYWFTCRVFRADVAWVRRALLVPLAGLAITGLGSAFVFWQARASAEAMVRDSAAFGLGLTILSSLAFAWTAGESLRYHGLLRRRMRLGLGDPVVANRMLLWAIWGLGSIGLNVVEIAGRLRGIDPAQDVFSLAAGTTLSLVVVGSLWLAFLPPEAWLRRLRARAPSVA